MQRTGMGYFSSVEKMLCCWEKLYVHFFLSKLHIRRSLAQDLDQEDEVPLRRVEYKLLEPYHKSDIEAKKMHEDLKSQILYEQKGFCKEGGEGDGY